MIKCTNECPLQRFSGCCQNCPEFDHCDEACEENPNACGEATFDEETGLAEFREALSSCVIYKAATPRFLSIDINTFSGLSMFLPNADPTEALWDFYRGLSWNQATGLVK